MVQSQSSESKSTAAATPEIKLLHNRRVYLQVRLPDVRREMKEVLEERRALGEQLKKKTGLASAEEKKVRQRWIYLVQRHDALKAEASALNEERKAVIEKLKP